MSDGRDAIEPRGCVTLRLGEIEALIALLKAIAPGQVNAYIMSYVPTHLHKLEGMRAALIRNAQRTVAALTP